MVSVVFEKHTVLNYTYEKWKKRPLYSHDNNSYLFAYVATPRA